MNGELNRYHKMSEFNKLTICRIGFFLLLHLNKKKDAIMQFQLKNFSKILNSPRENWRIQGNWW